MSGYTESSEHHLLDYTRVLHKRRRTAITAFVIVFGLALVQTFTTVPEYDARAQLLIEASDPRVVNFQEVVNQRSPTNDYYQTQYRILQSRALARRTLDATKLWDSPEFTPPGRFSLNPIRWLQSGWAYAVRATSSDTPPAADGVDETAAQARTIDALLSKLTIAPIRNSRLVDVTFSSGSPVMAARVANAVSEQYIEQDLEFRYVMSREASEWLQKRMAEQRKAVEGSEQALQQYRDQNDAVSLEDRQNIVVQRLAELNAVVTRARTERIQKEAVWQQIQAIQNDPVALDSFPLILTNSFIQSQKAQVADLQRQQAQMAEKLGVRHPDMVRVRTAIETIEVRIRAEVAKVVQALKNDYDASVAQERSLSASLEQQKQEALALNRRAVGYGGLQRDAAMNRQLFDGLLQRTRETDITGELKTSNIRIVDRAEIPRGPSRPNRTNNLLLGLFGGTFLALGLVFFFEYLDNRIKTPEEIKHVLGLPFLGMVPALPASARKALGGDELLIHQELPHTFVEAFRTLRTNVLFSSADDGSRTILITSTAPGEGKTLVSSNLAISLAIAGQRVLIVDCDMRRPRVHNVFKTDQEPGLSNVLVGNAKASDAVRKSNVPNLWILPAGRLPPNPAELLGSRRFEELLTSLAGRFDWIILDTPPVMAVTDASVLAHLVQGVVFVVGAEMVSRNTIKSALDQLDGTRAKYIGGVLNRVDLTRNSYYYSKHYSKSYEAHYSKAV